MKKKIIIVIAVISFILCINVYVQQKFIKTYTYTEMEYRGYTAEEISNIRIDHSYFRGMLGYNEWRISVEFEKEPDVFFWFTYKDNKLIYQGVSSEPMMDKETVIAYSEELKKGTLLK